MALGYTQIPGVGYTDNYSLVISDAAMRICLIIWLIWDCDIDQFDVETAFLEAELTPEEYVYMMKPDGMELEEDEFLMITKGMYGLTQVSRLFFLKMKKTLENSGFNSCASDQCLFYKPGNKGPIIVMLYVDDAAAIGFREDIEVTFELIR